MMRSTKGMPCEAVKETVPSDQNVPCLPKEDPLNSNKKLSCWHKLGSNGFFVGENTKARLRAGIYSVSFNGSIGAYVFHKRTDPLTDTAIDFAEGVYNDTINEIRNFWQTADIYKQYGFLHRRGYLLYGPAGTGKSVLLAQIERDAIKSDYIVVTCSSGNPREVSAGLRGLREVEPTRRIVCVFEDVDALISTFGESEILSLLDGEAELDHVLNLATTNYPEKLDPRIIARPRRFDRLVKIDVPDLAIRRKFFEVKLKNADNAELDNWAKESEGLSLASLSELIIAVKCHKNSLKGASERLKDLQNKKITGLEAPKGIGFNKHETN